MPRSKRDKKISLTKTSKKTGLQVKVRLVDDVRSAVEQFDSVYHFTYENLNNGCISNLRTSWPDSRFFFSKIRIMQLGLGRTKETEAAPKLHRLAKHLCGRSGLFFTNKPYTEVVSWFKKHTQPCMAQGGTKAVKTIVLMTGPLAVDSSTEPYLRKLGLSTELKHGQVNLLENYVVCTKGEVVSANNGRILKVLGLSVGNFRMHLKRWWSKQGETCKKIVTKRTEPDVNVKPENDNIEMDVDIQSIHNEEIEDCK